MKSILSIENLNKKYKDFSLKNISKDIFAGQIVGIIGKNGNGKSTLLKCILDVVGYEGRIRYFDNKYGSNIKEIKNKIGFSLEYNPFDENLTAKELSKIMKYIYNNWSNNTFYEFLEKFEIPVDMKINKYSKGMQVKLMIAIALSHEADILILDEPTSGLDPIARKLVIEELKKYIAKEERIAIFTTHTIEDLKQSNSRVMLIQNGEIMFDDLYENIQDKIESWSEN